MCWLRAGCQRHGWVSPAIVLLLALLSGAAAWAQGQGDVLVAGDVLAAGVERAPVYFDGLPIFEVRGSLALPAEERAGMISARLLAAARDPGFDPASITLHPSSDRIELRGSTGYLLGIFEADAALEELPQREMALSVQQRIVEAVDAYRAARTPAGVRRAIGFAMVATVAFAAFLTLVVLGSRRASRSIDGFIAGRIGLWEARAGHVVRVRGLWSVVRGALQLVLAVLLLVALWVYLDAVMLALPWTRDWGRRGLAAVAEPIHRLGLDLLGAVPKLIVLALIAAATTWILRLAGRIAALVEAGTLQLKGFEPEWALPTSRLLRVGIVLLAMIMAYPYIPGSSSDAFKAISIFAGIILSLGSSSLVANLIAGYSMIYRRAFRVGDRVEIAGVVGEVEALRLQDTHIRTAKNERVTLPNAVVLASHVINYSGLARDEGLILHTEVGIGYEVPWRQVEAMLIEAARHTPGIAAAPPPFVRQRRLADFAPVYELNAAIRDAKAIETTYSALHASIQDVFAERGVQIMTPNYVSDPEAAKIPPQDPSAGDPRQAS